MKELILKTIENLRERVSSPMLSSTAAAWVTINYKFIFILLSKDDFRKKFEYIDNYLYATAEQKLYCQIIYPVLAGFAYTLIYPLFDIIFVSAREYIYNLREKCVLKIARKKPIDREMIKEFYEEHDAIIEANKKSLSQVHEALQIERRTTREQISKLKSRLKRQTLLAVCGSSHLNPVNIFYAFDDLGSFKELPDHEKINSGFMQIKNKDKIIAVIDKLTRIYPDDNGQHLISHQQLIAYWEQDEFIDDAIELLIALGAVNEIDGKYMVDDMVGMQRMHKLKLMLSNKTDSTSQMKNAQ